MGPSSSAPGFALYQSPYTPDGQWFRQPLESLHCRPPARLLPWLVHPGSLTAALKHLSRNRFHVQVLHQRWHQPTLEERRELGLRDRQLALVREVLLYGGETPWVYARSVLPEYCLRGPSRYLRNLDNRPLGELLFSEPGIRRGPILLNRQHRNPRCDLAELADEDERAWGRRSTFWLRNRPLLVAETFLKAFQPDFAPLTGPGEAGDGEQS
ncbi:chorismate--pyruvate lyase family protein [Microbulbifer yueqingensis]|uniref:Probable chorismate pyruvate-lyase n=1 Tax=Microbulbifer yueqingensis TaxID=658219 RepID=A0A1G9BM32_9GAMM|nr:chorismate lyase [Microbulbifer yueqingensis]SDK40453.1 chorismate lyase [Microbulbifer yueqingensis]